MRKIAEILWQVASILGLVLLIVFIIALILFISVGAVELIRTI